VQFFIKSVSFQRLWSGDLPMTISSDFTVFYYSDYMQKLRQYKKFFSKKFKGGNPI